MRKFIRPIGFVAFYVGVSLASGCGTLGASLKNAAPGFAKAGLCVLECVAPLIPSLQPKPTPPVTSSP